MKDESEENAKGAEKPRRFMLDDPQIETLEISHEESSLKTIRSGSGSRPSTLTVDQSMEAYHRDLEKKQNSPEYLSVVMSRLRRFAGDYGDWLSCDISTEIVSEWLDDLELSATRSLSD